MAKILVTGSSGFIGRSIIKRLIKKYGVENVLGFSRSDGGDLKIKHFLGDVLDYDSVLKAISKADFVIHLASSSSGDSIVKRRIIVNGTKNIIKACKQFNIKKIIFMSSYGVSKINRDNSAKSKAEAEEIIKNSGLKYTILRPTLVYGKGGRIFSQIIKSTNYPFVFVIGAGNYDIGPVYVEDLADITIRSIDNYNNKTYNIIGKLMTYNEFIKTILKTKKEKKRLIHVPLGFILALVQFFYSLRIIRFDKMRILRAVESVTYNSDVEFLKFKPISPEVGIRKSIS